MWPYFLLFPGRQTNDFHARAHARELMSPGHRSFTRSLVISRRKREKVEKVRDISRRFEKVRECSRRFEKVREGSKRFEKVREDWRRFNKVQEGWRKFKKVGEGSRRFEKGKSCSCPRRNFKP